MINLHCEYNVPYTKFAFVGDLHLNSSTPASRIDNYPEACLNKLIYIRQKCIENDVKGVIFLGDIFHKPMQTLEYLLKVIQTFQSFKLNGIECFTIIGNHDFSTTHIQYLEKSATGILLEAGVLKPFYKISVNGLADIFGHHFHEDIFENTSNLFSVLVSHRFNDNNMVDGRENISNDEAISLNYDLLVLGHDHVPYQNKLLYGANKEINIIRPGSLTRGTVHNYNITRDIYFDIFDFSNKHYERLTIPCAKSSAIFSTAVIEDVKKSKDVLEVEFTSLINAINADNVEFSNVYSVINSIEMDERIKSRITGYLQDNGIYEEK